MKAEEDGGTLTKGGRLERDGFPDPLANRVPDRVDPANQVEMVDIIERALILSPVGRLDRDEAVVRAFFGEDDRVRPPAAKEPTFTQRSGCIEADRGREKESDALERVKVGGLKFRSPRVVLDVRIVNNVKVEHLHRSGGQRVERLTVALIGQPNDVQHRQDRRHVGF